MAGYDHQSGGGQVWTVPVGGMCVRQPVSIGGSGSTFLYGMMDHLYREKMPQDECEKLVLQMVTQAIRRDGSSGGCCRLATVTKVRPPPPPWSPVLNPLTPVGRSGEEAVAEQRAARSLVIRAAAEMWIFNSKLANYSTETSGDTDVCLI